MGGSSVAVLLLLLGLSWAEPASVAEETSLSYAEALAIAVNSYNSQPELENAFRLLDVQPQAEWDPTLSQLQLLPFTIKETECKKLENLNPQECPFKDNAQVKNCLALFEVYEKSLNIEPICELQEPTGPVRARRGLRKFIKKIKEKVKKLLPKGPILIPFSKSF